MAEPAVPIVGVVVRMARLRLELQDAVHRFVFAESLACCLGRGAAIAGSATRRETPHDTTPESTEEQPARFRAVGKG